jgi:hypothetical protein
MSKVVNLLEAYSKNYSESFLKERGYSIEKFLSETSKYFFNNHIFKLISEKFLDDKVPNPNKVLEKIKKISYLEHNTISLPYNEITDIINLSIFVEKEEVINKSASEKEYKIHKISEIFENGLEEEVYENNESVYSVEEVRNFMVDSAKKVTNDVTLKNENIVITFS